MVKRRGRSAHSYYVTRWARNWMLTSPECPTAKCLTRSNSTCSPNAFFFLGTLISMAYRFRPIGDDVDSCLFEILMLEPLPEGTTHPASLNLCGCRWNSPIPRSTNWRGWVPFMTKTRGICSYSNRDSKRLAKGLRLGIIRSRVSGAFTSRWTNICKRNTRSTPP